MHDREESTVTSFETTHVGFTLPKSVYVEFRKTAVADGYSVQKALQLLIQSYITNSGN